MYSLHELDLVIALRNFNNKNPEYEGRAYVRLFDDASGGIYFDDRKDAGYPRFVYSLYELMENFHK